MDTLTKPKTTQAMKTYNPQTPFLHTVVGHLVSVIALTFISLACLSSYWLPSSYSSLPIKQLSLLSLPNIYSSILSPKFLFAVVVFIVGFLIGESKLVGPNCSSLASEIHDEYVERSSSLKRSITSEKSALNSYLEMNLAEEQRFSVHEEQVKDEDEEFHEVEEPNNVLNQEDQEAELKETLEAEVKKEVEVEVEEDDKAEELNRRIEEFIAKVNRQRWLEEATLLDSRILVSCFA